MTSWKKLRSVQGIVITEIIVLVLMIAVFCAAVWLKFGTWFDNGEVEEAVRLMQTVREAQTQRCAQDNSYLVLPSHFTVLPAEGVADGSTFTLNHFTYDLLDPLYKGMGLVATHHTKNYKLEMPSYLDGRICCDNCQGLRRRYDTCAHLMQQPDFKAAVEAGCTSREEL